MGRHRQIYRRPRHPRIRCAAAVPGSVKASCRKPAAGAAAGGGLPSAVHRRPGACDCTRPAPRARAGRRHRSSPGLARRRLWFVRRWWCRRIRLCEPGVRLGLRQPAASDSTHRVASVSRFGPSPDPAWLSHRARAAHDGSDVRAGAADDDGRRAMVRPMRTVLHRSRICGPVRLVDVPPRRADRRPHRGRDRRRTGRYQPGRPVSITVADERRARGRAVDGRRAVFPRPRTAPCRRRRSPHGRGALRAAQPAAARARSGRIPRAEHVRPPPAMAADRNVRAAAGSRDPRRGGTECSVVRIAAELWLWRRR